MAKYTNLVQNGGNRNEGEVIIKKLLNFKSSHDVKKRCIRVNTRVTFSLKHFLKGKCAAMGGGSGGGALGMPNVVGVFIVTLGGCLVAT